MLTFEEDTHIDQPSSTFALGRTVLDDFSKSFFEVTYSTRDEAERALTLNLRHYESPS